MSTSACPACGVTNSGGQQACLVCGTSLVRAAPLASVAQTAPVSQTAPAPAAVQPAVVPPPAPPPPPPTAVQPAQPAQTAPAPRQLPVAEPAPGPRQLPDSRPLPVAQSLPVPMPQPAVVQPQPDHGNGLAAFPVAPAAAAFIPTHIVPAAGLETRARPDPALPVGPPLPPYLEVQVVSTAGGWAQIRCSNEWLAWVDARYLIARTF